ncbi:glycosyltransferase [Maridesulfovibrio zosterae]|uniref:glycosyltransferase n=1 Tax=Maridesulfovibrio zosterae TaxID=82171 RepID=UPI0004067B27|nr:glycosyltransferase [Maridesulfovibrio zosterae]
MRNRTIVHHTALAKSGGATRVAALLCEGLEQTGYQCIHSYEASEKTSDKLISPDEAAGSIPANAIVHLHSSADPAKFLTTLHKETQVVITLHDTQMITGGCSYPLDCEHFNRNCINPCPRNFPDSEAVCQKNISALLNSGALIVSPSRWLAKLASKSDERLEVKIIPNGIPWPEVLEDKKKVRKKFGLHQASKIILFIAHGGQDAGYKSGPQWTQYWNIIKKQVPGAIAFAIGGNKNIREGDFISLPYVDRETLSEFMLAADIFVYPTLADNHPLVILEAMSRGLTTVSYAVGGVPEQIIHNSTGILVPPYEKTNFADSVVALLKNTRLAREIGTYAFHSGKKKYNCSRMIKDYIKVYDNLA